MQNNSIWQHTTHLQVQSLIEHFWTPAVSKEYVLLIEISEEESQKADHHDERHTSTKG